MHRARNDLLGSLALQNVETNGGARLLSFPDLQATLGRLEPVALRELLGPQERQASQAAAACQGPQVQRCHVASSCHCLLAGLAAKVLAAAM